MSWSPPSRPSTGVVDCTRVEALDAGKAPGLVEGIAAAALPTNDQAGTAGELVANIEALDGLVVNPAPRVEALDAGKAPALDALMVNRAAG